MEPRSEFDILTYNVCKEVIKYRKNYLVEGYKDKLNYIEIDFAMWLTSVLTGKIQSEIVSPEDNYNNDKLLQISKASVYLINAVESINNLFDMDPDSEEFTLAIYNSIDEKNIADTVTGEDMEEIDKLLEENDEESEEEDEVEEDAGECEDSTVQ